MPELDALHWWEWILVTVYGALLLFIFFYSLIQLQLVFTYRKWRKSEQFENLAHVGDVKAEDTLPLVCVQLPIYNELFVVERLIDAVARFDYPKQLLEIQVLDDSTDETTEICKSRVRYWQGQGVNISWVHRVNRVGFKAGALAEGLEKTKAPFIAIFDADFVPRKDFLRKLIGHFSDPKVGMVQTCWRHLNEEYSTLTKLQAFGLNAHFTVEQGGRNASGCFINFNGTAGIWRSACIEDAGGWSSDTLTEDLDLSYRAQLAGWKFVYREDMGSPAELPAAMNALKTQQYRWTKGAAECTRKNLLKVWRNRSFPIRTKVHALFHLMNSFIFICVIGTALLSVPMLHIKAKLGDADWLFAGGSVFLLSMIFLAYFYYTAYQHAERVASKRFLFQFIAFLSMSMGLALHNAIAVLEGYMGKKSPFVRTPKFNLQKREGRWQGNKYLTSSVNLLTFTELGLALFFGAAMAYGWHLRDFGLMPFHGLLGFGFGAVGWLSLKHSLQS